MGDDESKRFCGRIRLDIPKESQHKHILVQPEYSGMRLIGCKIPKVAWVSLLCYLTGKPGD